MSNIIHVRIESDDPPLLFVEDNGGIEVGRDGNPQKLTWRLLGRLTQGNFLPMDAPDPGFSWVTLDPPPLKPEGPFTEARLVEDGNAVTFTDDNAGDRSKGSWIYMLRVAFAGKVYTTTARTGVHAGVNNPIIINR